MKIVKVIIGTFFIAAMYLYAVAPVKKHPKKKDQAIKYKMSDKRLKVVFGHERFAGWRWYLNN